MKRYRDTNYYITENGDVYSELNGKYGLLNGQLKKMKSRINDNGYEIIGLKIDGKSTTKRIHRMIAEMYIENPNNYPIINHKDGNKLNNHISNLEWCSYSHNLKHSYDNNLRQAAPKKGSENNMAKLTEKQVLEIRKLFDKHTIKEISEMYGVSKSCIKQIKHHRTWRHL